MKINYHNRTCMPVSNSENGQVNSETRFYYQQQGDIITALYRGGEIVTGQILGKVNDEGVIEMRYQHLDIRGHFQTGNCTSTPEVLDDGRIRLFESWQWTNGDLSKGSSVIEEIY